METGMYPQNFSDKELALFKALGREHIWTEWVSEYEVYRALCMICFLNDKTGPAVDSLKRIMNNWSLKYIGLLQRPGTFDDLIEL